jgi:hypothetical protein
MSSSASTPTPIQTATSLAEIKAANSAADAFPLVLKIVNRAAAEVQALLQDAEYVERMSDPAFVAAYDALALKANITRDMIVQPDCISNLYTHFLVKGIKTWAEADADLVAAFDKHADYVFTLLVVYPHINDYLSARDLLATLDDPVDGEELAKQQARVLKYTEELDTGKLIKAVAEYKRAVEEVRKQTRRRAFSELTDEEARGVYD